MNKLEEIYQVFAEIFAPSEIVIAGGAVRDTLMGREPKDYDVFILNEPFDDWKKYLEGHGQNLKLLLAKFDKLNIQVEWHKSEPYLIESISYKEKDVQFMVSPYKNIDELFGSFDWNVSLFAYGKAGYVSKTDIAKIKPGEFLELNKLTFAHSSLRRGYRFSERFTMRLHNKDIERICAEIVKLGEPKYWDYTL